MSKLQSILTLSMLTFALGVAWAQDTSTPPASTEPAAQSPQQPTPAYGQDNAPPPITENPPLSGLDLPSLEPHSAPLSYLQPGATFSESANWNAANLVGGSGVSSVTRGLGSLTLQRLWSHYDLALDYIGGIGYYNLSGVGLKSLQQADVDQKITWKRGQLSLRDSFSYLPEGNFGGSYGSLGSQGIAALGTTAFGLFSSGEALGTLGLAPRILNVSIADISQNLTPKSAVTVAGGYAFTHFYGSDVQTGTSFIGSSQTSAQAGYSRILTPHTQVALVYGYQAFDFTVLGSAFHTHVIQGMYGHRVSGRMDLLVGAGPQFTRIGTPCTLVDLFLGTAPCTQDQNGLPVGSIPNTRIGVAAQARLRYRFTRTMLDLSYRRSETGGSGLFAGAQSDIVRLSATRPLSRVWSVFTDIGYSHNDRLQTLSAAQAANCGSQCPGVDATSFSTGFAGAGLHRAFGRTFHSYASYQFNEIAFDHSYCGGLSACNRISNRSVLTFGLDWTPRPIRID